MWCRNRRACSGWGRCDRTVMSCISGGGKLSLNVTRLREPHRLKVEVICSVFLLPFKLLNRIRAFLKNRLLTAGISLQLSLHCPTEPRYVIQNVGQTRRRKSRLDLHFSSLQECFPPVFVQGETLGLTNRCSVGLSVCILLIWSKWVQVEWWLNDYRNCLTIKPKAGTTAIWMHLFQNGSTLNYNLVPLFTSRFIASGAEVKLWCMQQKRWIKSDRKELWTLTCIWFNTTHET